MTTPPVSAERTAPATFRDIPGWFTWVDKWLFDLVLDAQQDVAGDLVELGAYLGRSAVVIGDHLRAGERFVVIDLFGTSVGLDTSSAATANRKENAYSYTTLDRTAFERNYLALHRALPEVVTGPSSVVLEHVEPGTARFVHIDASHLYDQVCLDLANARTILVPDGVVVMDDYRSPHTPGVAAATWGAVLNDGLVPFAITDHKLYATWGDPSRYGPMVDEAITAHPGLRRSMNHVHGHDIVRAHVPRKKTERATSSPTPAPSGPPTTRSRIREWIPPALLKAYRARRR